MPLGIEMLKSGDSASDSRKKTAFRKRNRYLFVFLQKNLKKPGPPPAKRRIPERTGHRTGLVTQIHPSDSICNRPQARRQHHAKKDKGAED